MVCGYTTSTGSQCLGVMSGQSPHSVNTLCLWIAHHTSFSTYSSLRVPHLSSHTKRTSSGIVYRISITSAPGGGPVNIDVDAAPCAACFFCLGAGTVLGSGIGSTLAASSLSVAQALRGNLVLHIWHTGFGWQKTAVSCSRSTLTHCSDTRCTRTRHLQRPGGRSRRRGSRQRPGGAW